MHHSHRILVKGKACGGTRVYEEYLYFQFFWEPKTTLKRSLFEKQKTDALLDKCHSVKKSVLLDPCTRIIKKLAMITE